MSPSATPAKWRDVTGDQGDQVRHQIQPSATPATQKACGCRQVPRLSCKGKVDVVKCHACHTKATCTSPSATPASSPSATPATQSAAAPRVTPDPAQCHKCHACHTKGRLMSPSATPATQKQRACRQVPCLLRRQVPRLPRKVPRRHGRPQIQPSAISATPATQKLCVKDCV